MNNTNVVIVDGNLTEKPSLKQAGNSQVARASIAVNSSHKVADGYEKETSFFTVDTWGALAEIFAKADKGTFVRIVGRLKQETWEKDGQKRSAVKLIADKIDIKWPEKKKEEPKQTEEFQDDIPF